MADDFYSVTTPAAKSPISKEETKDFLRIDADITEEDALIQAYIQAVTTEGEKFTNRCFVTRTFLGKFQQLDVSEFEQFPFIQIRRAPLVAVSSVQVTLNDSLDTVSTDDYDIKESSAFSRILFNNAGGINVDKIPYPMQVAFTAGYGDPKDVPEEIKTALKMHVLFLYENRGDVDTEGKLTMPRTSKQIYKRFRILNTYG